MARSHGSYARRMREKAMAEASNQICSLVTMALEVRLKKYGLACDSYRKFTRDLILQELAGYYGGQPITDEPSLVIYNPECNVCRKRVGLPPIWKTVKTGIWPWLKRKLGC